MKVIDELSITIHHMDKRVIATLESLSDDELRSQNIVFRKLCGLGFPKEAVILLNMKVDDYECFITNTLADEQTNVEN